MTEQISPFAPEQFPLLPQIKGLDIAIAACGLRYQERDDFVSIRVNSKNPAIAAVFTTNSLVGEPVKWSRKSLPTPPRHLLIAAGNANVFTGTRGWQVLEETASDIAACEDITSESVYFAMTGVIGEAFGAQPLRDGLAQSVYSTSDSVTWQRAAQAIMTTDTFPKGAGYTVYIGDTEVSIAGIAKGSGMIAPDMATMLAFIFTDATIPQPLLQTMLNQAMARSFNIISVDSDTSTSDSVMCIATGAQDCAIAENADDPLYADFCDVLQRVCDDLAWQVVSDGEGVTRIMQVMVSGAETAQQARQAALSIANSPLVKTALSGADANWGRVIMAVGKSGVALDPTKVSVRFGEHLLAESGGVCDFDVAAVDKYVQQSLVRIQVTLGVGTESACIYGNDLSYDYIRINADYRS